MRLMNAIDETIPLPEGVVEEDAKKVGLYSVAKPLAEYTPEVEDRNDIQVKTRQGSRTWGEEAIEKDKEQQIRQITATAVVDLVRRTSSKCADDA